ncbi:hypothetical protein MJT46_011765 [Ovis ammon polii x Ovis aries]|nr:hypothetical protein MJT46_011765 [Ovis ammon polii x Ovis aries]
MKTERMEKQKFQEPQEPHVDSPQLNCAGQQPSAVKGSFGAILKIDKIEIRGKSEIKPNDRRKSVTHYKRKIIDVIHIKHRQSWQKKACVYKGSYLSSPDFRALFGAWVDAWFYILEQLSCGEIITTPDHKPLHLLSDGTFLQIYEDTRDMGCQTWETPGYGYILGELGDDDKY